MIERAYVHVGGPPGSGKTTFIEAMLAGTDALALEARCLRDDTLTQARDGAPRTLRGPETGFALDHAAILYS